MIRLQRRTFDVAKRRQIVYDIQRYVADQAYFGASGSTKVVSAWSRTSRTTDPTTATTTADG